MINEKPYSRIEDVGVTFRELCAMFPENNDEKLPTAKYLRNNVEAYWKEMIWGRSLVIYRDGHFTYSDGKTVTVQRVRRCMRPIKYVFADKSIVYVGLDVFMDMPYQLRLGWEGEMRLERNEIAKEDQRKWSYDNMGQGESIDIVDHNSDFAERIIREMEFKDNCIQLENAFKMLSEKQKTVVKLYFFNGLTQKAIGESLGCSKQSVNECLNRALKKMRGYFTK